MKFGAVPIAKAGGAILARTLRLDGGAVRKGTVLGEAELRQIGAAGIAEVVVARLGRGDIHEDEAARRVAEAIAGAGARVDAPFTGRANVFAAADGIVVVDRRLIDRLNRVDQAITVATLAEFAIVEAGDMIATVKIIPFGVPAPKVDAAVTAAGRKRAVTVAPFQPLRIGLVTTTLPSLKRSVMDKTRHLLDARLARAGSRVFREDRVAHEVEPIVQALAVQKAQGADLLVIFGATAVVDADDVVPAAIAASGGRVTRFGMPVDPGNLLVLGEIAGTPVVGAPGCARSPKENGFDWVLNRLLAGLDVTGEAIAGLGVGGLLTEIATRPQPRQRRRSGRAKTPKVAAVVLAAGRSQRMDGANKLVATLDGKPLVRIAVEAALASRAVGVTVVTGHNRRDIDGALARLAVARVYNPDYGQGLSTSVRTGIGCLGQDVDGAIVLLADMPGITAEIIDRLIAAFDPHKGATIVVPTFNGKRGNPVLWSSRYFTELMAVDGDTGGRNLIGAHADNVVEVEIGPPVADDIDTPQALAEAGGKLPGK